MSRIVIYIYLYSIITVLEAARILTVIPTPSISHQLPFRPLTQELAKRGHQVVVITTDPAFPEGEAPANLTEIDIHDVSYKIWQEEFLIADKGSTDSYNKQYEIVIPMLTKIFVKQLQIDKVRRLIQDKTMKFDLLLLEAWYRPALVFSHIFKVPVIQMSSFGSLNYNYDVIGAPIHPILYPSVTRFRVYNLTIKEKLSELYNQFVCEHYHYSYEKIETEAMRKLVDPDMPSLSELNDNIDMLFLNVHPIWDANRPVPSNVVYIGGIHQTPKKELPKDLKNFLDSSKNGVIYISFGTNVKPSLLPPEKIKTLVKVLSQLPYDILWKWDKDELPGRTKNIKLSKWLPQSDLLKHPKIKLFITQGGLQSTDEAIAAGVPMIGIPMLGDQWYNAEKYVHHKIGMKLEMDDLSEESLLHAINTVIGDESYRANVIKLHAVMVDQPESPLERAVWWIEHVLRHGGARHLKSPGANITWVEYFEIEFVGFLMTCTAIIVTIFVIASSWILGWVKKFSIKVKGD